MLVYRYSQSGAIFLQGHAFYPRSDRQRCTCTLRHVMPIYNVHPLFTICVLSPILHATIVKFLKNRKMPNNTMPDPAIVFETPSPAVALATARPTRQSFAIYFFRTNSRSDMATPTLVNVKLSAESVSTSAKLCVPMNWWNCMNGGSQTHPKLRSIAHLSWRRKATNTFLFILWL
ncbi:hypothetical protein SFRURICE_017189 [Spodoptera frugiperda]|nr:hypothetical protein SFRURICE_017189 [Spodoptera frugiperda]